MQDFKFQKSFSCDPYKKISTRLENLLNSPKTYEKVLDMFEVEMYKLNAELKEMLKETIDVPVSDNPYAKILAEINPSIKQLENIKNTLKEEDVKIGVQRLSPDETNPVFNVSGKLLAEINESEKRLKAAMQNTLNEQDENVTNNNMHYRPIPEIPVNEPTQSMLRRSLKPTTLGTEPLKSAIEVSVREPALIA